MRWRKRGKRMQERIAEKGGEMEAERKRMQEREWQRKVGVRWREREKS